MNRQLMFVVNGLEVEAMVEPHHRLLDVLRGPLGLTGTKEGCGEGECGACTVLLDGAPVCSCLTLAVQAAGRMVTTIEGLADGEGRLHPVQQAFIDAGAIQCGFCTPGMILTATALLADLGPGASPSAPGQLTTGADPAEVRTAIAGNLCRCTGYTKIVDAMARKGTP